MHSPFGNIISNRVNLVFGLAFSISIYLYEVLLQSTTRRRMSHCLICGQELKFSNNANWDIEEPDIIVLLSPYSNIYLIIKYRRFF